MFRLSVFQRRVFLCCRHLTDSTLFNKKRKQKEKSRLLIDSFLKGDVLVLLKGFYFIWRLPVKSYLPK